MYTRHCSGHTIVEWNPDRTVLGASLCALSLVELLSEYYVCLVELLLYLSIVWTIAHVELFMCLCI